ncbi:hypothetical protein [Rhizobium sp. BG4]|uniref:hypothetical protein n=1 Tax=Rhizobium sp. BG4 TaxID=2613770 RepID=UPI00193EA5BA|nr:hypothetical protein [Rhizobium sp. BG4]QRM45352.1 hypothetical protein F2982_19040 [Rhizobium sp. BG4]
MHDKPTTVAVRISNVLYWACTGVSLLIVLWLAGTGIYMQFIETRYAVQGPIEWERGIPALAAAVLIFLIGRAVRYVVTAR